MNVAQPWKKMILRMADGEGAGGGEPAAAAPAAAPAGDKAAAPAAEAAPAVAISDAAKAANDALASAKNPSDKAAEGVDESGKEGKEGDKADDADNSKKEAEEAEAKKWEAEPAELYKELKYPEGIEVAPEAIQPFLEQFKAEKVAPEMAQKIVDWHLQATAQAEQVWVQEITNQWDAFTKDTEFCKDNKLTPAAEQAYGKVRALSPEVASFFTFLNKNGGMFHPGLVQLTKLINKGIGEGDINQGKTVPKDGGGADAFYSKSKKKA